MRKTEKKHPFVGKHRPVIFITLFLPELDLFLKLSGDSTSKAFKELGQEALFKSMQRAAKKGEQPKNLVNRLKKAFPDDISLSLIESLSTQNSEQQFKDLYVYELFFKGVFSRPEEIPYQGRLLIDIEKQTKQIDLLQFQKRIDQSAIEQFLSLPIIEHLFWPELKKCFIQDPSIISSMQLRVSVLLEILLSVLAALDLWRCVKADVDQSLLLDVLPLDTKETRPARLLFDVFKTQLEADSINDLLNITAVNGCNFDESFFKRWSSAKVFPSNETLNLLIKNNIEEKLWTSFGAKCDGARIVDYICYLRESVNVDCLPFRYVEIIDWIKARYPFWFNYHINQYGLEGKIPSMNV